MRMAGVIVNARAGRARRDPELPDRLRERLSAERVRVTRDTDEVEPALASLREQGVDTLVLVGGDGTVHGTLTPLLRIWPADALPDLVVTPGGTVNTIARSLGARGTPDGMLERLLASDDHPSSRRPVVEVRADGGRAARGLVFVNGVGVRWLELYHAQPRPGPQAAAQLVARIAGSALVRGALARRLFEPFEAHVEVDGERLSRSRFTVMAASSVQHIGLGFRPFPTAGTDPERIHFATTSASAPRIVAELPSLRSGRAAWQRALSHHPARRVVLRHAAPEPWSIDAEAYPPAREVVIEAGPALRFLCP